MTTRITSQPRVDDMRKGWTGDIVIKCPVCKALETVSIVGGDMLPARKFTQIGNRIFHDCSRSEPCHLYRVT